jgi:protein-S-isoprenylcysteine O-methyltransferase Ste14
MYLGGSLAMFAIAFLFTLDWLPLLYLPGAVLLHLGIIVPEEQYLESKFGEEYRRYSAKVPRYFGAGFER